MKLSSIETKWFHTRGSDEPLLLLGLLFLLIHLLFQRPLPRLAEVFFGFLRLRGLGEGGFRGPAWKLVKQKDCLHFGLWVEPSLASQKTSWNRLSREQRQCCWETLIWVSRHPSDPLIFLYCFGDQRKKSGEHADNNFNETPLTWQRAELFHQRSINTLGLVPKNGGKSIALLEARHKTLQKQNKTKTKKQLV